MVNEEKVKLMSRLAIYEEGEGKKDIAKSQYYKMDYVRYHVMKSVIGAIACYLLIVAGYVIYNIDIYMEKINTLDYKSSLTTFCIGLVIFVVAYSIIAGVIYSYRFEKARPRMMKYHYNLKKLSDFYAKDEDKSPKNINVKGEMHKNDEFIEY